MHSKEAIDAALARATADKKQQPLKSVDGRGRMRVLVPNLPKGRKGKGRMTKAGAALLKSVGQPGRVDVA